MALKFLNKKGWHTGSLRNIENVWKAEQKHDAEQKKLEELRKQIHEERERSEFRLLQEQAGLVPRQERLEFLYDSGLAVGKGSSDGFKALESFPKTDTETASSSSAKPSLPGALFEEKPQSSNDAWRKLHSDPLLLIRQREQEALARVKNNPIRMALIRKTVEEKKQKRKSPDGKELRREHKSKHRKHEHSKSKHHVDSDSAVQEREGRRSISNCKSSKHDERLYKSNLEELSEKDNRRKENSDKDLNYRQWPSSVLSDPKIEKYEGQYRSKRNHDKSEWEKYNLESYMDSESVRNERGARKLASHYHSPNKPPRNNSTKLSEEERAARLQQMQMDADLHEEQRWKRLRKAEEDDAQEATRARSSGGRNFLDAAQRSVYGAEKGGSSTIEESVRRRTHYLQGRSEVGEGNAFRR